MNEYNGPEVAPRELDVCAVNYGKDILKMSESELMRTGFIYDKQDYRISFLTESGEKNTVIVRGENLFSKIKELNAQGCSDGTILGPLHEK